MSTAATAPSVRTHPPARRRRGEVLSIGRSADGFELIDSAAGRSSLLQIPSRSLRGHYPVQVRGVDGRRPSSQPLHSSPCGPGEPQGGYGLGPPGAEDAGGPEIVKSEPPPRASDAPPVLPEPVGAPGVVRGPRRVRTRAVDRLLQEGERTAVRHLSGGGLRGVDRRAGPPGRREQLLEPVYPAPTREPLEPDERPEGSPAPSGGADAAGGNPSVPGPGPRSDRPERTFRPGGPGPGPGRSTAARGGPGGPPVLRGPAARVPPRHGPL